MLMLRFLAACVVVTTATLTASAQTPQVTVPSGQNSGAGIPGTPGTQSGAVPNSGTGGSNATNEAVREQDPGKIRGLPGTESGGTVFPPSGSTSAQNAGN